MIPVIRHAENFFADETEEEKQKAAYVSQQVALHSEYASSVWRADAEGQ
jgi:hypothetical protein